MGTDGGVPVGGVPPKGSPQLRGLHRWGASISLGAAHVQWWWGQAPDRKKKSPFSSGKVLKNSSRFGAVDAQLLSSPGAARRGQPHSAAEFVLWNFASHPAREKPRGWGCHLAWGSTGGAWPCGAVEGQRNPRLPIPGSQRRSLPWATRSRPRRAHAAEPGFTLCSPRISESVVWLHSGACLLPFAVSPVNAAGLQLHGALLERKHFYLNNQWPGRFIYMRGR